VVAFTWFFVVAVVAAGVDDDEVVNEGIRNQSYYKD
jgi:hypothetical protein